MQFKGISIRFKILGAVFFCLLLIVVLLELLALNRLAVQQETALVSKSRVFVEYAEAVRNLMADKLEAGVLTSFEQLAKQGASRDTILSNVPVITAIQSARQIADKEDFKLRVPKIQPRNPDNQPDETELKILKSLESGEKKEVVLFEKDQLRYFKPIVLTQECMVCHGDPAGSTDPVGGIKEGWKVGEVHGAFEVLAPLKPLQDARAELAFYLSIVSLLLMVIVGFLLWKMVSKFLKPLDEYVSAFSKAQDGDLTIRLNIRSKDEIGHLSNSLNSFLESFEKAMGKIKLSADDASNISKNISVESAKAGQSTSGIALSSRGVEEELTNLDKEVETTVNASRMIQEFFRNLAQLIQEQAASVTESSASIEEISASIHNIARTAGEREVLAGQLEKQAALGEEKMSQTVKLIAKVASAADGIMGMIQSIEDIAGRTNLLAMNAAIEAAHAGESGRGFAVVASEIRKLSENTAASAKNITSSLKDISEYIQSGSAATQEAGKTFAQMVERIGEVAAGMVEMKHTTFELSEGSKQILEALGILIHVTEEVRTTSGQMDERIEDITGVVNRVQSLSASARQDMKNMAEAIKALELTLDSFQEAGQKNAEVVKVLETLLQKFKYEDKD